MIEWVQNQALAGNVRAIVQLSPWGMTWMIRPGVSWGISMGGTFLVIWASGMDPSGELIFKAMSRWIIEIDHPIREVRVGEDEPSCRETRILNV